ncbi:hypothetical protein [Hyphomonas atlantica]|uniref:Uncharacterized protein n=1 Tax=Hyphomonas atlantica TaxID=1280948 RepID=A0A059DYY0_9PROT|nr:hypothetical protein [Hyphomonas atlantica]KCZ59174.1 hypothetical protein HY36_07815 [Hyphomonas atlantica]HAE95371.1 hypothetical protein [Hyphomonas atlantica]HBQ47510.1 hypothetical protein [Hyphomonas atlantica]|tara:strand:- start:1458 stop:1772 length:315 start_codon:yes stop_codon:yes gene_type:complete
MTNEQDKYQGQFADAPAVSQEELRARNSRNRWLGIALAVFVILVGVITFIRLSSSDLSESGFYYNMDDRGERVQELPTGMTPEQAAPPPNLTPADETPSEEDPS